MFLSRLIAYFHPNRPKLTNYPQTPQYEVEDGITNATIVVSQAQVTEEASIELAPPGWEVVKLKLNKQFTDGTRIRFNDPDHPLPTVMIVTLRVRQDS